MLENLVRDFQHSKTKVKLNAWNSTAREDIYGQEVRQAELEQPLLANLAKLEKTKIYIKNMVSIRCKMVVKAVLDHLHLDYTSIELGEVEIMVKLSDDKYEQLRTALSTYGFTLLQNKNDIIIQKIKQVIIEMVHYSDELPTLKLSCYLSEKLNYSYNYLARVFSEVKGESIQHFVMAHKIERVKELIAYDDLSLTDIAWKLQYSSVAHLSTQFKAITGLTPSQFRDMKHKHLKSLDEL